jgi:hypothetical protein
MHPASVSDVFESFAATADGVVNMLVRVYPCREMAKASVRKPSEKHKDYR